MVHRLMGTIPRTKTKNIANTKKKSLLLLPCSVSYQKPCDPHHVIAAILDAILNILQR